MKRALVVDDDESIRLALRVFLEDEGYAIEEAANGNEALALLRNATGPRLVLLDFMMPRLDGAGVLRVVAVTPALRSLHAYILVTATDHPPPSEFADLLTTLEVPLVSKPFDLEHLLTVIEMVSQRLQWEDETDDQRPATRGEVDRPRYDTG